MVSMIEMKVYRGLSVFQAVFCNSANSPASNA